MDIQATKLEIIKLVADLESEKLLDWLRQLLKQVKRSERKSNTALLDETPVPEWLVLAREPMPASLDLDAFSRQQGYNGARLQETLDKGDYSIFGDHSLRELLSSLTK